MVMIRRVDPFARQDNIVMFGGLLAGLLASIAMLVILAFGTLFQGQGLLAPLKLIATTAFGPEVAHKPATAGVIVTGLMIHMLVGIAYGIVFGFIADAIRPRTTAGLIATGVCYGLAIYLLMFLYIVPSMAPLLGEQQWIAAALGHIAYGATVALYWPITERLHRAEEDVVPIKLPSF
jgi:hypothetical protein